MNGHLHRKDFGARSRRPWGREKRERKGCDWIVANDVAGDVMGGEENMVHLITGSGTESWERLAKEEVARRLATRVAEHLTR